MKMKRILSTVLAFLMMLGCFASLTSLVAFAEGEEGDTSATKTEKITAAALKQQYATPDAKLIDDSNMQIYAAAYDRQIWCNPYTGEVYFKDTKTGEILASNPYDMSNYNPTENFGLIGSTVAPQAMSQILISYKDITGAFFTMNSYTEAAQRGQIQIKYIKNGARVEYTMGRLNSLYLLPHWISCGSAPATWIDELLIRDDDYEYSANEYNPENDAGNDLYIYLIQPMIEYRNQFEDDDVREEVEHQIKKLVEWYAWKDNTDKEMQKLYPCLENGFNIFAIDEKNLTAGRQLQLESIIKTYATKFSYDTLAVIHEKTGYEAKTEISALFRLAVEYTINSDGSLQIRVPGNSVRYDETNFTLENISLLPYMGAINTANEGFIFYPDGSGSIIGLDKFYNNAVNVSSNIYGYDYSYYSLSGNMREPITMPVFGSVQTVKYYEAPSKTYLTLSEQLLGITDFLTPAEGSWNYGRNDTKTLLTEDFSSASHKFGFVAIVEEGESMMTLVARSEGASHSYAGVYTSFNPRPKDTYDLADSISVSGNTEWTVVSDKQYSGNFKYRVYLLTDDSVAASNSVTDYFPTTWIGMAKAYRNYLEKSGIITALNEENTKDSLPLYIETFGSIKAKTKFLSIPVTSNVALTTFENIMTMHGELADKGITNVNFKLTGYYNGGLSGTYPSKLKWVGSTGGKSGFRDLLEYAADNEKGKFGVFVDFDFSYATSSSGISLKKNATKTVDGKYSNKKVYNPAYQEYVSYFDICINAASIAEYVDEMTAKYSKFKENNSSLGISVSTLGGSLNSDFNEDAPINREKTKDALINVFEKLQTEYPDSVMSSTGNAYVLKYVDHLLGVSIDSNQRFVSTYTVPFTGMILHGYVNFTGTAVNESGDPHYQILKSIENGASLYYVLSYANTTYLKEDENFNKYYSIRYDIWKDQLINQYNTINGAIGDLQLYKIDNHQFIKGERVLDKVDIENRNVRLLNDMIKAIENTAEKGYIAKLQEVNNAYEAGVIGAGESISISFDRDSIYSQAYGILVNHLSDEQISQLGLSDGLTASIKNSIDAAIAKYETPADSVNHNTYVIGSDTYDFIVNINSIEYTPNYNITDAESTEDYTPTEYTIGDGSIVMVTYTDGTSTVRFVINYNLYDITVKIDGVKRTVGAYSFIRI